ncbi:hypothetical protein [Agarivorans sp. 1_MG-2023]|uniref:hypothetical protein n=1 Tax=Agarivorans sp. 1_MG-2023 TaxID=3062634 RepID=UPI0026E339C5|nr:hypothetical protein [Agarivorans sp. 1_MG-2023]MDO6762360.1 hypothetical protein [Agarivorans sp. 1_MG-2023]
MKIVIFISIFLVLVGCSSTNRDSFKYINSQHRIGEGLENEPSLNYPSYEVVAKRIEEKQPPTGDELKKFVQEAVSLTYSHCMDTINEVVDESHRSKWQKEQFLIGTTLVTGLMAINGASNESFQRLALATAFLVATSELYRNYYLLGPDAYAIKGMIQNALNKQIELINNAEVSSFPIATKRIYDFANMCTSNSINAYVSQSLLKAEFELPKDVTNMELADLYDEVDKILNESVGYKELVSISKAINLSSASLKAHVVLKEVFGKDLIKLVDERRSELRRVFNEVSPVLMNKLEGSWEEFSKEISEKLKELEESKPQEAQRTLIIKGDSRAITEDDMKNIDINDFNVSTRAQYNANGVVTVK